MLWGEVFLWGLGLSSLIVYLVYYFVVFVWGESFVASWCLVFNVLDVFNSIGFFDLLVGLITIVGCVSYDI